MTDDDKILLRVSEAAHVLSMTEHEVYVLARAGHFTKRYVGKGTRNFRLQADEVREYAAHLPTEPAASR